MKSVQSLISTELKSKSSTSTREPNEHTFNRLPSHILRRIFRYFTENELRKNIIPVCQLWREAGEDPVLWRKLEFHGNKISSTDICNKIWQFNLVNKIIIWYSADAKILLRQICRCTKNLTHLVLRHCSHVTEESLRYLITTFKNLKSLDLKGSPFECLIFYEELAHARALEEINFSDNPFFTIKHIMTVVVNVKNITGFHLSSFKPTDSILLTDADCYFLLTHTVFGLKYLTLDCSCLSSYTFNSIMRCKNLEYICLNYAFNLDGKQFENMWTSLTKLKALKIRFAHNIKDSNMNVLFGDGEEVMKFLEIVDFTGCTQMGDEAIEALANCCPFIKSLVLRNCPKIKSIRKVFKKCEDLEILNVAFCKTLYLNNHVVPSTLREFFIDDCPEQRNFAKLIRQLNCDTVINVCQSEFNKSYIKK